MRIIILSLLISFKVFSQKTDPEIVRNAPEDYVHLVADKNPSFKGSLFKFLVSNVKFPKDAQRNGITGKVGTTFIIRKDGSVDSISVIDPVHPSLDAEAKRVIKLSSGKWEPGEIDKKKVDVRYQMPIKFSIQ